MKEGWLKWTAGGVGLVIAGGLVTLGAASRRWSSNTSRLIGQLMAGVQSTPLTPDLPLPDAMQLPEPVSRYFRSVFPQGQPAIRSARLTHQGTFFVNDKWYPFRSEQVFVTGHPGFVWDARIKLAPLVDVCVRDIYINRQAAMHGAILGLFTLVDQQAKPELNGGALHRYLAEAMWFPTVLLPGERLVWAPIDDFHAVATLTDGPNVVSLQFEFAPNGDIVGAFSPDRFRESSGPYIKCPWGVTCRRYEERGGMRIPVDCEVYWKDADRIVPYWRGEVVDASYDFE